MASLKQKKTNYTFILPNVVTGREYYLAADSEEELEDWIRMINTSLKRHSRLRVDSDSSVVRIPFPFHSTYFPNFFIPLETTIIGLCIEKKQQKCFTK